MNLSPQEAAAALAEVDQARTAMRRAIRDHRGHYYLWIWGATWIAMPLTAHFFGDVAVRYFAWLCLPGAVASVAVGLRQRGQIVNPALPRLFGAYAAVLVFAAIFPFVLQGRPEARTYYAYACLACMQGYVIIGLWTDRCLLWLGLFVTAMILVGFFLLPGVFWLWMAACTGAPLVLTGFYIRHRWR
jgi:hypothetical protein